MDPKDYPILEFDPSTKAIIEPPMTIPKVNLPEHCLFCFFREVIEKLRSEPQTKVAVEIQSELGMLPIYEYVQQGRRLAVLHPGLGAPMAAAFLECAIAGGARRFIVCGGAGVLEKTIVAGQIVVPVTAVRDEGTSYHYLSPAREVSASPEAVAALERVLKEHNQSYTVAKTWTTDAFFRETHDKIELRRAEGCLTVEMEAAAFFAVAQFRGVKLGQILYAGDDVSGEEWDQRTMSGRSSRREELFRLAAEACLLL